MKSLGLTFSNRKICINLRIYFSKAYKDVRNSQISAVQYVFNSANVVMQQETTKALNEIANIVLSDREKIEDLNSTKSRLIRQVKTWEKRIRALQA